MNPIVLISVCIPAYKNITYLQRLLDSIAIQTFTDYEVVITDDSPDNSVEEFLKNYKTIKTIRYFRNPIPLGTPENWNEGIRRARGTWIKIMHDDDWFTDNECLRLFAAAAIQTDHSFIFSGFYNVNLADNSRSLHQLTAWRQYLLNRTPYNLLAKNVIGHPSTTLIRNEQAAWYNERLKWLVDIEFYIRILNKYGKFYVIKKPLVCLGISNEQVTKAVFRKPEVEVPENICLINMITPAALQPIRVFDYFWRFIRNLGVRDIEFIKRYNQECPIPSIIEVMVKHQQSLSPGFLKVGILSKAAMSLSYLYCRLTGKLA